MIKYTMAFAAATCMTIYGAESTRLVSCEGASENGIPVEVVVFLNEDTPNKGHIFLEYRSNSGQNIQALAETEIDVTIDPDGYPYVTNNEFGMHFMVSDEDSTYIDFKHNGTKFEAECRFAPIF